MLNNLNSLIGSTRFWTVIATVAVSLLKDKIGLSEDQITSIVMSIGAWLAGESLRATSDPNTNLFQKLLDLVKTSRRFWLTLASVASTVLGPKLGISPETITTMVLAIGSVVLQESLRSSLPDQTKK